MIKFLMKRALPLPKLLKYERYVFVAAHPDDIEIGAGGTAARLAAMGKSVTYIIATDGRYGTDKPAVSPSALAETRKEEARAAAKLLGIGAPVMLGFFDGGGYDQDALTLALARELSAAEPDIIFTIDHTVPNELHPDHLKVGAACSAAAMMYRNHHQMTDAGLAPAKRPLAGIAYFFTHKPNRYVNICGYFKKQIAAMRMHKSQMLAADGRSLADLYKIYAFLRALRFGMRRLKPLAEGFRTLGPVHMHCAPEMGE